MRELELKEVGKFITNRLDGVIGNDAIGGIDKNRLFIVIEPRGEFSKEFRSKVFRGLEFGKFGASSATLAPGTHNRMVCPYDAPRLRVNGICGRGDVPLRKGGHKAGYIFTGSILEFKAKWVAVKDVGRNRVVTKVWGETDLTVMNDICREASLRKHPRWRV